jgi:hypothetical protein
MSDKDYLSLIRKARKDSPPELHPFANRYILSIILLIAAMMPAAASFGHASAAAQSRLMDLNGSEVDPLKAIGAKVIVFLFTRTDCPISNRYAPEVKRLARRFASKEVKLWLVYVDPEETVEAIRNHIKEYEYRLDALRDARHALVKMTKARVTPEAAVFVAGEKGARLVYRGRIDDRFVDFGKMRRAPTTRDLESALEAVIEGKPVALKTTTAVGCFIPDLQ